MRALTHFSLLAIAVLVAARSPAIGRQYAVSRPGEEEETPSFASAVLAKEVKRSLAAVERPQRLAPRNSTAARKESEFFPFYSVAPPTQRTWRSNDYVNALRLVDYASYSIL